MANSVVGALRVNLSLASAAFLKGLNNARDHLKKAGKQMQSVGRDMSTYVSAPLAGFGALIAKTAGDFEQGMNRVQAVSGATGDQLAALSDQAKELGRTTQFSANQAADAMGFLAQAGFKADQILGAMPGTLQLAASANLDLGATADIVSNVLQGYGKEVSELGHVNDVLVTAFTKSNTNLQQLGESLKYAGPVASSAGVQFEETAAALGLMGNAGIQASMAGTSLRGAISRILSPTSAMQSAMKEAGLSFTDAHGKLLPLNRIVQQLEPHADDAGLMMKLFGQRAGPAMAALVSQGSGSLRDLTTQLENSGGTAERIAKTQMEGFNGQMRALRSAFEGLQIAIADSGLLQWLTQAAQKITQWIQALAETNPKILKWGTVIAGITAVVGPLVLALGALVAAIGAIGVPVAAVVAGLAGLSAAVVALWPKIKMLGQKFVELKDMAIEAVSTMVTQVGEWITGRLSAIWDGVANKVDWVTGKFQGMYQAVVGGSYVPDMVTEIGQWMARLGQNMVEPAQKAADGVSGAFEGVGQSISGALKGFGSSIAAALKGTKEWKDVALEALSSVGRAILSNLNLGGGIFGGLFKGLLGGLLGFANGGSFTVGGGGGIDSQLVAFKATPGETVDVRKPGQEAGGGNMRVTFAADVDKSGNLTPFVTSVAREESAAASARVSRSFDARIDSRDEERRVRRIRPMSPF